MDKDILLQGVRYTDSILKSIISGYDPSRALIIDLSKEECYPLDIPQAYLEKYYGGVALGARLWADFAGYSADDPSCSEEENPIVIVPSAIRESKMPYSNLSVFVFRSPVTGRLFNFTFNSNISVYPYLAVVITGRAEESVLVKLNVALNTQEKKNNPEVSVLNAEQFSKSNTQKICNLYRNAIVTGIAAEKECGFASLYYDNNVIGRAGIGLVFKKKNLKGLILPTLEKIKTLADRQNLLPENKSEFFLDLKYKDTIKYKKLKKLLSDNVENSLITDAFTSGWAPVDNFSGRTDPRYVHLLSVKFGKNVNCAHIPVECRLMLGSNLGFYDINHIGRLYDFCLAYGIDPISLGNLLGVIKTLLKEIQSRENLPETANQKPEETKNDADISSSDKEFDDFSKEQAISKYYGNVWKRIANKLIPQRHGEKRFQNREEAFPENNKQSGLKEDCKDLTQIDGSIKMLSNYDFDTVEGVLFFLDELFNGALDIEKKPVFETLLRGVGLFADRYGLKKYSYFMDNLECGPVDYRGLFSQALSDINGNNVFIYLDCREKADVQNVSELTFFNERLSLGLECLGINPEIVYALYVKRKSLYGMFLKHKRLPLKHIIPYRVLSDTISLAIGKKIKFSTVLSLGLNSMALIRKINSFLDKSLERVPDYFCADPVSAYREDSVVPFNVIKDSYNSIISTTSYN